MVCTDFGELEVQKLRDPQQLVDGDIAHEQIGRGDCGILEDTFTTPWLRPSGIRSETVTAGSGSRGARGGFEHNLPDCKDFEVRELTNEFNGRYEGKVSLMELGRSEAFDG